MKKYLLKLQHINNPFIFISDIIVFRAEGFMIGKVPFKQ